jgi:hypothetical protein
MLVFSEAAHPEDITCFLPSKKGDDALVHGWEVQPVGLVLSPMAAQGIETLFKHQPFPDAETSVDDVSRRRRSTTSVDDVKWIMEECGYIMRHG